MDIIKKITIKELSKLVNYRIGEVKLGEKVILVPEEVTNSYKFIKKTTAKFVVFGIPEDVGVKANYGRVGASSAYANALKSLVNMQHNKFCKGNAIILLGSLNVDELQEKAKALNIDNIEDRKKLHHLITQIDKEVSHIVHQIIKAGKIPIIIGGGHNNAYGNIKGLALAKGKPVNVVNFDAHTDFRALEGRHSGNGFSYAFKEGFLQNYMVFGLHENYVSKAMLSEFKTYSERLKYISYDDICVTHTNPFEKALLETQFFIEKTPYGIEIDLDAIENVASSAITPSGFDAQQARRFVSFLGKHNNAQYLHICEGAPSLDNSKNNHLTGKLIAYLITDFIKSKRDTKN